MNDQVGRDPKAEKAKANKETLEFGRLLIESPKTVITITSFLASASAISLKINSDGQITLFFSIIYAGAIFLTVYFFIKIYGYMDEVTHAVGTIFLATEGFMETKDDEVDKAKESLRGAFNGKAYTSFAKLSLAMVVIWTILTAVIVIFA